MLCDCLHPLMRWAVARCVDRGESVVDVAARLALGEAVVRSCCHAEGVRCPPARRSEVMSWEVDEMEALRAAGMSHGEIARATGRGESSVRRHLARRGVCGG